MTKQILTLNTSRAAEGKLFRSLLHCHRICRPNDVFLDAALLRTSDSLVATVPQRERKALYRFCEAHLVSAIQKLS